MTKTDKSDIRKSKGITLVVNLPNKLILYSENCSRCLYRGKDTVALYLTDKGKELCGCEYFFVRMSILE